MICLLSGVCCLLTGCSSGNPAGAWPVILVLLGLFLLLVYFPLGVIFALTKRFS
jgi:MYXO-CTERM domain-containing protein